MITVIEVGSWSFHGYFDTFDNGVSIKIANDHLIMGKCVDKVFVKEKDMLDVWYIPLDLIGTT